MSGKCSMQGRGDKYDLLVGNPEGKRPLGRCRLRWEDNTKIGLRIWVKGVNCIHC
jgi:hypothetical protein